MTPRICPPVETLKKVLQGTLVGQEDEEAAAHLQECDDCMRMAETFSLKISDTLGVFLKADLVSAEPQPTFPEMEPLVQRCVELWQKDTPADPVAWIQASELRPSSHPEDLGLLAHYRVRKHLATGGMGIVFEALDTRLRRDVAVKFLQPRFASDREARDRFLAEARALAKLRHERIVTVHEVGGDDALPYLVMERLQGQTLDSHAKLQSPLLTKDIARIGQQIAEGLAEIHRHGVVHRDIKPANIWLEPSADASFRVKLLDFGLAKSFDNSPGGTERGCLAGTPAFMSPEQAAGESLDPRSDLFSLGSVLYFVATGKQPFPGSNTLAILSSLANDVPASVRTINEEVSSELSAFITMLLAKRRDERPASAEEVAQTLARIATLSARTGPIRRAGVGVASVLAMAAMFLLVAAGIVIRIRTKDGTQIEIPVPAGSKIEIAEQGSPATKPTEPIVESRVPKNPMTMPPLASTSPLDALRREDIPPHELRVAGGGDPLKAAPELVAVLGSSRLGHFGSMLKPSVYHPNGERIATADTGAIRIWDAKTGELQKVIRVGGVSSHPVVNYSPNGSWLAFSKIGSSGRYSRVVLMNEKNDEVLLTDSGQFEVTHIEFSPDGESVVASFDDGFIRCWGIASRAERWAVTPLGWRENGPYVTAGPAKFRPDGKVLAVFGNRSRLRTKDKTIPAHDPMLILDAGTGKTLHEIKLSSWIHAAWSADGRYLAFNGDWKIHIVDGQTWNPLYSLPQKIQTHEDYQAPVFNPNNSDELVIVGKHNWAAGYFVWSMSQKKFLRSENIKGLGNQARNVVFRPDGKVIAFQGLGGVHQFDTETWKPVGPTPDAFVDCAISSEGRYVYAGGTGGGLWRWDISRVGHPPTEIDRVPFIRHLSLATDDRTLQFGAVWSHNFRLDVSNSPVKRSLALPNGGDLGMSRTGDKTLHVDRGSVRIFDAQGQQILQIRDTPVVGEVFYSLSPDGEKVVRYPRRGGLGPLVVWNARTGDVICKKEVKAESYGPEFSPDGSLLAIREDNRIVLLDSTTLELKQTCKSLPNGQLLHCAFSPDGKTLACATGNGKLQLHDVATGENLRTIPLGPHAIHGVRPRYTADGRYLLTANYNGTVFIFRIR